MNGRFGVSPGQTATKVTVTAKEDEGGGVVDCHRIEIEIPNERWEHFIFTEAKRLGFNPQIPEQ